MSEVRRSGDRFARPLLRAPLRPRTRTTEEPRGAPAPSSASGRSLRAGRRADAWSRSTSTSPWYARSLALFTLLGAADPVLVPPRRVPSDSTVARVLYAFGLSLLGLILVGLAARTPSLPVVGVDHPLHPVVLAITWLVLDVGLLALARRVPLVPSSGSRDAWRRALDARFETAQTLAVVGALLLAVVGAIRLNNGAGGAIALVAQVLAAAALVVLMLRPEARSAATPARLALVATSLLLATSLRGWGITGHDIQAEFLSFQLTNDDQHWQMSALAERLQRLPEREHPADRARADDRPVRRRRLQGPAAAGVRAGAGADLPVLAPLPAAPAGPGRGDLHDGVPDVLHRHALPGAPGDGVLLPGPDAARRDRAAAGPVAAAACWSGSSASASCSRTTPRPT